MRMTTTIAFFATALLATTLFAAEPGGEAPAPTAKPRPARHYEGLVTWEVRDADTGAPIPCKLTFVGVEGTRDPEFTHNDIGKPEGDLAIAAYQRVFSAAGDGAVRVPPGTYDVYVSRGLEWDVAVVRKLKVTPEGADLVAQLHHVIDSVGWYSADFHVHAAPSPDSTVPLPHRVIEFIADGIDLLTSTDHNIVTDYGPTIKALGVGHLISTIIGDEITTASWGHFGAFPLPQDLARAGQGAVLAHGRTPKAIFEEVHTHVPGAVIDVHHPRIDPTIGYFTIGEFDPHVDRAGKKGFSFDFDAIEVLNGYQDPARRSVDRMIDDYLGLLNHGHLATATGNSDTHHLTFNMGGYPRNYLRVPDDRIGHVTPQDVAQAVRAHHVFFTTGPFIRMHAGQADIGDLVAAPSGHARVEIEVDAAPWVSVDRVILYVNGKEAQRWPVPPSQKVARFRASHEITLAADGYALVRVDGNELLAPVVGDRKTFGVYPLALSNPIFFDVNNNGRYDPAYKHGERH